MKTLSMLLLLLLSLGLAQEPLAVPLGVGVTIPQGSILSLSHDRIAFDLGQAVYPPREFPAYYGKTSPTEPLELRLFSNMEGSWALHVETTGLFTTTGEAILPSQLEYRLDDGPWLSLGPSIELFSGRGASQAFERYTLDLRLKITGAEAAGFYEGLLIFRLTGL
jgi:hypothetical protein